MSDQPRPVWLTREQRTRLDRIIRSLEEYGGLLGNTDAFTMQEIRAAWDAAPADAEKAAMHAIASVRQTQTAIRDAVLRALGKP